MRRITKRFGPVLANDGIDLMLHEGEIHAVLGENGAGKTTLMNILSGMYQPDAGTIYLRGQETKIASPADALRQGIGAVYQHFTLVPNLSVIENVILGTDTGFVLDLAASERKLAAILGDFDLNTSPRTEVRHLAIGQRQRIEIIKVLFRGSRILLLDEPTSVLTPVEVEGLFAILLRLKADGVAVVLITHKLEEALAVSDRVTILRQARNVGEFGPHELAAATHDTTRERIVELMFGDEGGKAVAEAPTPTPPPTLGEGLSPPFSLRRGKGGWGDRGPSAATPPAPPILLSLRTVSALDDRGATAVHDLSLELHAGEVFGIAGVDGNGQKELGEVIAGQRTVSRGSVVLDGRDLTNRGVAAAARVGVGYVTDDRLGEGCVPSASVAENVVLKSIGRKPFSNGFWLNRGAIDAQARKLVADFDVRTPGTSTRIADLSGGNIQKLLLARELAQSPKVLVCNKPTTGLDVRTARFVLQTLREQADAGKAVILISSELDEIFDISDRIGVISNGRLVAVFSRAEADVETIGHLMLGGRTAHRGAA